MKLKSISLLGLLAATPMVSQAAMVELNETEMSSVNGQASFTGAYNFNFGANYTLGGYGVQQTFSGEGTGPTTWSLGKTTQVVSPYSGRTYFESKAVGNDGGTKYIDTHKSWGRNNG